MRENVRSTDSLVGLHLN